MGACARRSGVASAGIQASSLHAARVDAAAWRMPSPHAPRTHIKPLAMPRWGVRGGLALGALVFGAGIGALATEITASRLLAPYFGSSTIVWANLIGIVLAALAVGYWLGGRVADRRPEPSLLGFLVLGAAVFVAAIPFVAKPLLDLTVEGLDEASAGAVIGSFLGVLLLCAPPVVLLGMVSPFAIRLAVTGVETAGAVAGRLYALSTAGSVRLVGP